MMECGYDDYDYVVIMFAIIRLSAASATTTVQLRKFWDTFWLNDWNLIEAATFKHNWT